MAVSFRYAARTDLGTVRTNNEDSAFASPRLLILADGMGGHAAGEVASTMALRMFAEVDQGAEASFEQEFPRAGRATRRVLHAMSEADPILDSMGTTLVAIGSDGDRLTIGHIGDSRVYLLREDDLYQITSDHTHVQHLIDTGQLTAERARTHPYRSMLLKSLDDQPTGPELDLIGARAEAGDRLLLCSDGLSDYLEAEDIRSALATADRDEAADALIEAALQVGTRDNVTVVVADLVMEEDETSGTEEPADRGHGARSGRKHPLAGAPVVVGAADDGISLSEDASRALRHWLPDFPFHPGDPMSEALIGTPQAPAEQDNGPAHGPSAAGDRGAEGERGAAGDGPSPDGSGLADTLEPPAPQPQSASQLPGALAAAAIVVLVLVVWLVLG